MKWLRRFVVSAIGKDYYAEACRKRAEEQFDKDKCFEKYVELYEWLIHG